MGTFLYECELSFCSGSRDLVNKLIAKTVDSVVRFSLIFRLCFKVFFLLCPKLSRVRTQVSGILCLPIFSSRKNQPKLRMLHRDGHIMVETPPERTCRS